jgi:hypothetical protein
MSLAGGEKELLLCNDFGCNVGHFFRGVSDINIPIDYRGYDISETYLRIARENFGDQYFFNYDLSSESLFNVLRVADISVISATLEHIDKYHVALNNIFLNTRKLVVLRTFVGNFGYLDYCRTYG